MTSTIMPLINGNKVTFRFHGPQANMVNVLGTFNHWDITGGVMQKSPQGEWTGTVDVPLEGSYDYKFLVDGEWILDPLNPDYGRDSKDRYNSRFQILTSASAVDHLRTINAGLEAHPAGRWCEERGEVFRLADRILQLPTAAHNRILKGHFVERMNLLAARMERRDRPFVAGVYCHGNVIQRGGRNLGIDVVTTRSVYGMYWDVPSQTVEHLAAGLDALCVSHLHPDHLDPLLIRLLLARNAPVLVPEEVVGRFPQGVTPVAPGATVSVDGWNLTLHKGVHVYDERKQLVLRYVEAVAKDGFRMVHTCDHDYTAGVATGRPIDLLIAKAGGVNPAYEGRGKEAFLNLLLHLRPSRFLPGHLNELGHPIRGGREPYATGLEILAARREFVGEILHWGECWDLV